MQAPERGMSRSEVPAGGTQVPGGMEHCSPADRSSRAVERGNPAAGWEQDRLTAGIQGTGHGSRGEVPAAGSPAEVRHRGLGRRGCCGHRERIQELRPVEEERTGPDRRGYHGHHGHILEL